MFMRETTTHESRNIVYNWGMDTNTSGVYAITNTVTGSQYVGSAINIAARWASHRHALRNHRKAPPKLQRAWDKYGEPAFSFSVLELCEPQDCLAVEQRHIDALKPRYNTRQDASSNYGVRWSTETNRSKGRPEIVYTVQGVSGGLHTLCKHFGVVTKQCAQWRILKKGMSVEEAVLTPPTSKADRGRQSASVRKATPHSYKGADLEFRGIRANLKELTAKFAVVGYYAVRARVQRGWPLEKALLTPAREQK
jgi:hypothetical protein